MSRAAIYLRVSTDEQTTENQRPELEAMARSRRLELVEVYEEKGSAARRRPVFDRLLDDARRGRFEVLVVWALDRLGRSMVGNLQLVLELDRIGVRVLSAREGSWLDTTGPARTLLLAVFSWIAEQERERLVERTKAGMDRARREGKRIGRPIRMTAALLASARRMRQEGRSLRRVAMALHVPLATVAGALARARKVSSGAPTVPLEEPNGAAPEGGLLTTAPFRHGGSAS